MLTRWVKAHSVLWAVVSAAVGFAAALLVFRQMGAAVFVAVVVGLGSWWLWRPGGRQAVRRKSAGS